MTISPAALALTPEPLPLPQTNLTIRPGTLGDLPFIDSLQKQNSKQVGFFPTKAIEGKIRLGHVLVAVEGELQNETPIRVGYLIGNDQYHKRDDVGCIFQINVLPSHRRQLVAASLLKAQFERSAYGCKLYSCWCAQDIEANRFWEKMGFTPLAYRVGSELKGPKDASGKATPRVHIFWQRRIRRGDVTTPWWFPSKTSGGSIREDRIVLPILPGTHWQDAKRLILPGQSMQTPPALPDATNVEPAKRAKREKKAEAAPAVRRNGLIFDIPRPGDPIPVLKEHRTPAEKAPRVKRTCDPRLVSAARELKDRWLEHLNTDDIRPIHAKYDVARQIENGRAMPLLDVA